MSRQLWLNVCSGCKFVPLNRVFTGVRAISCSMSWFPNRFCARLKLPLQPRMTRTWFRSIGFLAKLLGMDVTSLRGEASALVGPAGASGTEAAAELRMSWLQEALVPHAMQKGLITQALLQPKPLLQLGALVLLLAALERLQRALRSPDWMPTEREDLQNRIQGRLPDLNTLLLLWQKLSKDGETSAGITETQPAGAQHSQRSEDTDAEEEQKGGQAVCEVLEEDVVTLLGLPGPLASHTIFTTWCKNAQRYIEVLPQSAADVKFDWSKLLSAVASPLLSGQGPPLSAERLRACVQCVGAAMQARSLSLQLSKSQRVWLETLLQLRSASSDDELCSDCTEQLVRFIGDRKVCGHEHQVELQKLLAATKKWPQSVGFFCQALQSVLLRPGFFFSEIEEKAYDSLLLLALVRQLARRDPQGLGLPSNAAMDDRRSMAIICAKMTKQSMVQLAMQLPATAQPLAALVRGAGEWIAGTVSVGETQPKEDAAVASQGDPEGAEGIRQSLLEKLEGVQKSQKRKREEATEVNGIEGLGDDAAVTDALNDLCKDGALQLFFQLDSQQRSKVLRTLASRSDAASAAAFNKVLSCDSESLLRLALEEEPTQFTPPHASLTSGVAMLLERLCHLNPKLKEAVASQLSWRTGSPAIMLRLAAALAPLEQVAWMEEAPPSPSELLPLPKEDHLVELFATTPMPVLEKTVLQALDAKEKPHAGATRSRRLQLRLELRRGNSPALGSALGNFLDVVGPMKAADHKLVAEALALDKLVFSSAEEALKQYVQAGVAAPDKRQSVAALLGVLQVQARAQPWEVTAARRLITDAGEEGEVPEWMLEHAVCWWADLLASQPERLQDFVQCVQTSYGASRSRGDLLRRQLLVAWAAEDASVSIQVPEAPEQELWAFRAWVGKLESWVPVWGWDLDARRLRATTESFSFDRSSIDPLPRLDVPDARQERLKEAESYDIAYLLPFFAGQLRAAFMQSGANSKAAWGPALGALMCGGALELLLLGLACRGLGARGFKQFRGVLSACASDHLPKAATPSSVPALLRPTLCIVVRG
ncbi:unnamed protein product [Symbiodinium necroappetens]|uniref:Uncharacterized protein n=1 Tax=Symbiodinium necroappetens TaxID=1628268 RepID=A0A812UDM0_9DINO|nr:unnamed protein product [Symbiodinium necroappetens]